MNHLLACEITYQGKIEYGTAFGSEIEQALTGNVGRVEDIAFEIGFHLQGRASKAWKELFESRQNLKQAIGVGWNVDRGRLIAQFDAKKIIRSQQTGRRRKFANQLDLSDLEVDPLILDTVIDFATRQLDRSGKIWILIPHAFEWHPPEGDILGKLEIA